MDAIETAAAALGVAAHRVRAPDTGLPVIRYSREHERAPGTTDGPAPGVETIYFVEARAATFAGAGNLLDDLLKELGDLVTRTRDRVESTADLDGRPAYAASLYVGLRSI